jgi:hypothetical protein
VNEETTNDVLHHLIKTSPSISGRACAPDHEYHGEKFTHLVVGGEKRTLKLLFAIAFGAKIVKEDWLFKSLENGSFFPEDEYIPDKFKDILEKSKVSKKPLLHGLRFAIVGHTVPEPLILENLIVAAGGSLTKSTRACDWCITGKGAPKSCIDVGHKTVRETWLFDCVGNFEILSEKGYEVTRDECEKWTPMLKREENQDDWEPKDATDEEEEDCESMDEDEEKKKSKGKKQKNPKKMKENERPSQKETRASQKEENTKLSQKEEKKKTLHSAFEFDNAIDEGDFLYRV